MYYGRKKGIIIAVVVVIVLAVLAAAGAFLVLKTDLFKSNKTLFWKYASNLVEKDESVKATQLEQIEKLILEQPYTSKGSMSLQASDQGLNSALQKIKVNVEEKTDMPNGKSHIVSNISYDNNKIFGFEFAKDGDIYALKSDEIVTAFLGVRNENLKVLAQKLGITDTEMIPDKVSLSDLPKLSISESEMEHIKEIYSQVIVNSIPEENYSKESDVSIEKDGVTHNTKAYRLDLSGSDITKIIGDVLETLKTDSITLNMIATNLKAMGAPEEYTTVSGLGQMIEQINALSKFMNFNDISFVVYSDNGQAIAMEAIVKNLVKLTIFTDTNRVKVQMDSLSTGVNTSVATDITYRVQPNLINFVMKMSINNIELATLNMTMTGSAAEKRLQTEGSFAFKEGNQTIGIDFEEETEFVDQLDNIIELNQNNCAILNDYPQDQLQALLQAVAARIEAVMQEKEKVFENIFDEIATQMQNQTVMTDTELQPQVQSTPNQADNMTNSIATNEIQENTTQSTYQNTF